VFNLNAPQALQSQTPLELPMCLGTALICPSHEPICVGHCLLDQHFIFSPQCSQSSFLLSSYAPLLVSFVSLLRFPLHSLMTCAF